jgi:hypothetical protein
MPAHEKKFMGKLQPSTSRVAATPPVQYDKGGDDFRCPSLRQTSSFGRQIQSGRIGKTDPRVAFRHASRFVKSDTLGPGPGTLKPYTAMLKQGDSRRRTASNCTFGTSSRTSALRLYAVYTTKK